MKGLSLMHGDISASNIFLRKSLEDDNLFPELKLLNYSESFFIDEIDHCDL